MTILYQEIPFKFQLHPIYQNTINSNTFFLFTFSLFSHRKRFPFYDIEADPDRNTVVFRAGNETFSVEELVAQILQKAQTFAEESTSQQITECVIVVPGFFGQAERNAMLAAANLANIKVLQLINDYTAVALNYGIFRQKEINETAQYFVFYDMGAYKTSAAVVSFQLVKDKLTRETNPVIQVLGVGYDRTLGGLEMQLRLRDYLATEFNAMKKTPTDVFTSPRAMAKLQKEAGRVKNVLSANANHFAQIEGVLDEKDFKFQVTREKFEELSADLFARVTGPFERALAMSGLPLDVINQVILFGGGTRVPKVQEALRDAVKQDLGKNINMDEAAVLGAVYKAADLAIGFKVKKIVVRDAVLFPIQVAFEREGDSGTLKTVRRSLFSVMNTYPQKKVITFNKHTQDFAFTTNYAEMDQYLSAAEIAALGAMPLNRIQLKNVANVLSANTGEGIESKGIKAHFAIDDSGLFAMSGVELVVEKPAEDDTLEGTFAKLGSTITKLFGGDTEDKKEEPAPKAADVKPDEVKDEPKVQSSEHVSNEKPINQTQLKEEAAAAAATKNATKPKFVTVKEPIANDVQLLFAVPLTGDKLTAAKKKLDDLTQREKLIARRETALNALESFVIEANLRLDEDEYASCATKEEADAVRTACAAVSDWLYEDGENADADTYEKKLLELSKLTKSIYERHWEHSERPEALKTLNKLLENALKFLKTSQNLTKDANPDKDVFTQVELDTLDRVIGETVKWRDAEVEAQSKLQRSQAVRLTVKAMADKMVIVDREVNYLISKLKIWKPKVPPPPPPAAKKEKKTTKGDKNETVNEEQVDEKQSKRKQETETTEDSDDDGEPTVEEQLDFPEVKDVDSDNVKPTKVLNATDDKHTEL